MFAVTDAWKSALTGTTRQVFLLVELLGIGRFFSNVTWQPGGPWTLGDGALLTTGLTLESQHTAYEKMLLNIDQGGVSDLSLDLDDASGASRVGNATVTLVNTTRLSDTMSGQGIDNSALRLRLGIGTPLGRADMLPLWYGFIDRWQGDLSRLTLECVAGAFKWHRELSLAVGGQYFPGTPATNRGAIIPVLVGLNLDVEAVQVSGAAIGHLGFEVSSAATECFLREIAAPFPISGTVTLGTEAGVTYSGRDIRVIANQSYLRLFGLVRGAPVTQSAGASVVRTNIAYDYLVGYAVFSIIRVRNSAGTEQSPATYTVVRDTTSAPSAVTLIRFTSDLGASIRVDCEGGNILETDTISNGGFEAGDTSGWTVEAGASAVVTTTAPQEGTYRLELTGAEDSDRSILQAFPVAPRRSHVLSFYYQDTSTDTAGNLFTNGNFASRDLTGWTEATTDSRIVYVFEPRATFGIVAQWVFDPTIPIAARSTFNYEATLLQDATTVATVEYEFRLTGGGAFIVIPPSAGDIVQFAQGEEISLLAQGPRAQGALATRQRSGIHVELGTVTDPTAYGEWTIAGDLNRFRSTTFTATSTTTRVRVTFFGEGTGITPSSSFLFGATLRGTAGNSKSFSSWRLGTPSDDDVYDSASLGHFPLGWSLISVPFVPTESPAQLTLLSQYDNAASAQASLFDNVSIQAFGRNPVDVIRYIIETFVPELRIDEPSFTAAHDARRQWLFGGQFRNPGNSRELLDRLADQCACRRFEDGDGRCVLVALDSSAAPVFGFATSNIVRGSLSITPEPLDNIFTHIFVHYNLRAGDSDSDVANYGAVAYATPTETTADASMRAFMSAALGLYGREHRLDYFADAIQDDDTAQLLLGALVQRHALRTWDVRLTCGDLGTAALQVGDMVVVTHPLMPEQLPQLAEVQALRLSLARMQVEIVVRLIRLQGSVEEWEAPAVFTAGAGSVESWNASFSQTTAAGSLSPWEATELLRHRRRARPGSRPPLVRRRRRRPLPI